MTGSSALPAGSARMPGRTRRGRWDDGGQHHQAERPVSRSTVHGSHWSGLRPLSTARISACSAVGLMAAAG